MLAGFESQDRGRGMPVVGSRDPDRVDMPIIKDPPKIGDSTGSMTSRSVDDRRAVGEPLAVDVANIGNRQITPCREQAEMGRSHTSGTDQPDRQVTLGRTSGLNAAKCPRGRSQTSRLQ